MQYEISIMKHHPCCLIRSATHVNKYIGDEKAAISPVLLHKRYYYCSSFDRHNFPYKLLLHYLDNKISAGASVWYKTCLILYVSSIMFEAYWLCLLLPFLPPFPRKILAVSRQLISRQAIERHLMSSTAETYYLRLRECMFCNTEHFCENL